MKKSKIKDMVADIIQELEDQEFLSSGTWEDIYIYNSQVYKGLEKSLTNIVKEYTD